MPILKHKFVSSFTHMFVSYLMCPFSNLYSFKTYAHQRIYYFHQRKFSCLDLIIDGCYKFQYSQARGN